MIDHWHRVERVERRHTKAANEPTHNPPHPDTADRWDAVFDIQLALTALIGTDQPVDPRPEFAANQYNQRQQMAAEPADHHDVANNIDDREDKSTTK